MAPKAKPAQARAAVRKATKRSTSAARAQATKKCSTSSPRRRQSSSPSKVSKKRSTSTSKIRRVSRPSQVLAKTPAAAVHYSSMKKRPAASQIGSLKKKAAVPQSCKKIDPIISALTGVEELPSKARKMLEDLVGHSLGLHAAMAEASREIAMQVVGEAICSVEEKLVREFEEALATVDETQACNTARDAAQMDVEVHLQELRNSLAESKTDIKESAKAIQTFQQGLRAMKADQIASERKLTNAAGMVEQLQQVDQNLYQPLKSAPAKGAKGQKQLSVIQTTCKELGFQSTLLDNMPNVLKKALDKRRTQDGIMMDEFESEVSKHYVALETALKDEQSRFDEFSDAVQEAHARITESELIRRTHVEACTEAESALAHAKTALAVARQSARKQESNAAKCVRDLSRAEARLHAFRSGVLAAFEAFQAGTPLTEAAGPEKCSIAEASVHANASRASVEVAFGRLSSRGSASTTACPNASMAFAQAASARSASNAAMGLLPGLMEHPLAEQTSRPIAASACLDVEFGFRPASRGASPELSTLTTLREQSDAEVTLEARSDIDALAEDTSSPALIDEAPWASVPERMPPGGVEEPAEECNIAELTLEPTLKQSSYAMTHAPPSLGPGHYEADTLAWAPTEVMSE